MAGGATHTVNFTVSNADAVFNANPGATAFPNLGGPDSVPNGQSSSFDWGLPFFFGRDVYVLIETKRVNNTTGPAIAF